MYHNACIWHNSGRSIFLNPYGFSREEPDEDFPEARKALESKLIFGLYPQIYREQGLAEIVIMLPLKRGGSRVRKWRWRFV
jgi:hypothetical protein